MDTFILDLLILFFAGKTLIDYTSLSSPYDSLKNGNIILSYFKNERKIEKYFNQEIKERK